MNDNSNNLISAVIPVFNEKENLNQLQEKLIVSLNKTGYDYEIIYIDDGSNDGSLEVLTDISKNESKVRVIKLKRNYGQTAALQAGIQEARGTLLVTLDADLQNDPENIPNLVHKINESGADVISGWRSPRKDPLLRKLFSACANWLISIICGLRLHDYGCTLKVYRAGAIKELNLYGEMHRLIPAFIWANGGKVLEEKVVHHKRKKGRSSYGIDRTYRVILDIITIKFLTTYASRPNHVLGSIGLLSISIGFLLSIYVVIRKIAFSGVWLSPMFFIAVFLIGIGILMIMLGIIAEIAIRIYFSQGKSTSYKIDKIINA